MGEHANTSYQRKPFSDPFYKKHAGYAIYHPTSSLPVGEHV